MTRLADSGPTASELAATGLADNDGYNGPATFAFAGGSFAVQAELRGNFDPVDGRYHWYGRLKRSDELSATAGTGRSRGTITTPGGSADCDLSDPDTWGRYRVTGASTPPFPVPTPGGAQQARPAAAALHDTGAPLPPHASVAIIGAGFSGLGAAIRLRQAGVTDFVILERASEIGGTWRDNSYPGCACDVPSHLYSYSFAPNPAWSRSFSGQPEIWRYLRDIASHYHLDRNLRLRTELLRAWWDPAAACWHVDTSRGTMTATVLIAAGGPLSEPAVPAIPGLDTFPGPVFHSARWDESVDLAGKRVAVIGTGASAIQIVPQLARSVAQLTLFQRTPAWVLPRRDRRITDRERRLYERVPAAQKVARFGIYASREATVGAFIRHPALLRAAQRMAAGHLARTVPDPALRARLTPNYVLGCKRILLSDDYYPALSRPNARVISGGLASVDGATLTGGDGTTAEVDAIVLATGFEVTDVPIAHRVFDGSGQSLASAWGGDMSALRGTTVAGFPNLCLVIGPNTGLGHTSMIYMIESQLPYIEDYVKEVLRLGGHAALDAKASAQQRWNSWVQRRMSRTVWSTGGCRSWYLSPSGRNPVLWPGSTLTFRRATRRLDAAEYEVIPAATSATPVAAASPGAQEESSVTA